MFLSVLHFVVFSPLVPRPFVANKDDYSIWGCYDGKKNLLIGDVVDQC